MLFSIVIPTYNRAQLLLSLLDSLERLHIPENTGCEILIVDNNSPDHTREIVDEFIKRKNMPIHYFFEKKQGATHARNRGIREVRGEIIAFLDDDETVDKNWLVALREGFDRFQCVGIGGKVVAKWTSPHPDWYTMEGPFRIVGPTSGHNLGDDYAKYSLETPMPSTGNLAVKRECFQKYGCFSTDLGLGPIGNIPGIGDDTEFCLRLFKGGGKLIYSPKAIVYNVVHKERVTKEYCKSYHFLFGRVQAKIYEPEEGVRTYGNVPRYLFREYLEALLSLMGAAVRREKQARFYYRLRLSRISGQIFQLLQQRQKR